MIKALKRWKRKASEYFWIPEPPDALPRLQEALWSNNLNALDLALEEEPDLIANADPENLSGNDIIHMIMMRASSKDFLLSALDLIKTKYNYFPVKNLNSRKYTPLQTFMINNPNFHERNLGAVLMDLVPDIFPIEDLPHGLGRLHSFFWLQEAQVSFTHIFQHPKIETNPIPFYNTLFLRHQWDKVSYPPLFSYLNYEEELNSVSFEFFCDKILGRNTKNLRRLVFQNMLSTSKGFSLIPIFSFFSKIIQDTNKLEYVLDFIIKEDRADYFNDAFHIEKINYQRQTPEKGVSLSWRITQNNYNHQAIPPRASSLTLAQEFIETEGLDRFLKFFIEKGGGAMEIDTLTMYKMYSKEIGNLNLSKFSNQKELHDFLSKEITKLINKPFKLNQDNIASLNGIKIDKETEIFVPEENHEIILGGAELQICIGSGRYAQGVVNKYWNIVFLKQYGKYFGAIQFDAQGIIEAKLKCNKHMPDYLIKEFLEKTKDLELPERNNNEY